MPGLHPCCFPRCVSPSSWCWSGVSGFVSAFPALGCSVRFPSVRGRARSEHKEAFTNFAASSVQGVGRNCPFLGGTPGIPIWAKIPIAARLPGPGAPRRLWEAGLGFRHQESYLGHSASPGGLLPHRGAQLRGWHFPPVTWEDTGGLASCPQCGCGCSVGPDSGLRRAPARGKSQAFLRPLAAPCPGPPGPWEAEPCLHCVGQPGCPPAPAHGFLPPQF